MNKPHWRRLFPLAWTHARAFGGAVVDELRGSGEERRSDDVRPAVRAARFVVSVLMVAMSLFTVSTARLRKVLYVGGDDRTLIVVKRPSTVREAGAIFVVIIIFLTPGIAVLVLACSLGPPDVFVLAFALVNVVWIAAAVWLILGAVVILVGASRNGFASSAIGRETPGDAGNRWTVESLAARAPADGGAAFRLAVRVLGQVPSGQVLVAAARTKALRDGYVRLGFSQGSKNRVFKVT